MKHKYYISKCIKLISLSLLLVNNINKLEAQTPVGTLPGTIDVSPTGMATYSIPIEVVPGTQGMQPNLSIVYNSQGGNGALGLKWDIAGLSAITRVTQTLYHDNNISDIQRNNNDRFVLDGNRLMVISGVNGADGTLYGTEMETFLKIKSCGQLNGAPDYFKVIREDGSVVHYGGADNSRQYLNGVPCVWMINKIIDIHGNYVRFKYDYIDGMTWIKEIEYTGNNSAGLSPYAKVTFTYQENTATKDVKLYMGGFGFKETQLLQKITVSYNNSTVREYTFAYSQNDKYVRLTHITLSDENTVSLNPTVINWGNEASAKTITQISSQQQSGTSLSGDINGDGIQDIIYYNIGKDNDRKIDSYIGNSNEGYSYYKSANTFYMISPFFADIDGDEKDELLFCESITNSIFYLDFEDNGITLDHYYQSFSFLDILPGDFNGDGKVDIVISKLYQYSQSLSLKEGFYYFNTEANPISTGIYSGMDNISKWYAVDFNGNGKTDILITSADKFFVFEYNNNDSKFHQIFKGGYPTYWHTCYFGDFNGDGIQDIISKSASWEMHLGTGKGYTWPAIQLSNMSSNIKIGDFDGDGKDDIVKFQKIDNYLIRDSVKATFYLTRKINESQYTYENVSFTLLELVGFSQNNFKIGDINFDGKADLIYLKFLGLSTYAKGEAKLVKKITDGLDNETDLEYTYLAYDRKTTYKKVSFPLVKSIKQSNGIGNQKNDIYYCYKYPTFDFKRKSFLGFENFYIHNNGISILYKFQKNNNYRQLYLSQIYKYKRNSIFSITSIEKQNNNVVFLTMGNKRFLMYDSISENIDYLNHNYQYIEKKLYKTYPFKGRDSIITISYKSQQGGSAPYDIKQVKQIKYSYRCTNDDFVGNILTVDNIISKEYIAGSSLVKDDSTYYIYYGNTSTLLRIKEDKKNSIVKETQFTNYNAFGIPTSIQNCAPYSSIKKTMDNTGRFVIKEISMNTDTTVYTYCPKTGNVLSVQSFNHLKTNYEYDTWGRITKKSYPDGNLEITEYGWSNSYGPRVANDKTVIHVYNSEGIHTYTYLDKLGRVLWKRSPFSYIETKYNTLGQTDSVSFAYDYISTPYTEKVWTTYKYDYLGRLIDEINPTMHLRYCYAPRSVTTLDFKRSISYNKTFDVISRVISSTDPEGTINYTYTLQNYNNQVCDKTQISAFGKTTTIITDLWGNKLSLTDPDAGTITYSYDGSGRLLVQTDANGNQTTYSRYDKYGRANYNFFGAQGSNIRRNYIMYDSNGRPGTLTSETQLYNGQLFFIAYKYDTLYRLIEKRYVQRDDTLRYKFTYDTYGHIDSIVYPFDFTIRHSYFLGRPSTISWYESGVLTPLYQVNSYFLGTPEVTTSLATTNTLEFNNINQLISKHTTIGSDTLQKFEFSYDNKGRLIGRTNRKVPYEIKPNLESFMYDNMDRLNTVMLTTYPNQGTPISTVTLSMSYDDNKISSHSNIGMYQYDQSHALTNVVLNDASSISQQQCDITYTPFNKVETITEGANNYKIEYYPNHQKGATSLWYNNTLIEHKLYAGKSFEWETVNDKKYYYIYSPEQPVAVFIQEGDNNPIPYLILTDHLGSVDLITDRYGNVVDSMSFDAWGNRRNYNNWQQKDNAIHLIDCGFTMHQHLDSFNLINMEGRVYDPVVAQFLSPDPYVQAPDNTQNLNRYTYCLNSPLMYIDPTGEKLKGWQWLLIGLGADLLTGGILSSSLIATTTSVHTTVSATAFTASTTLASIDFGVCFGKAYFDDGQAMDNWWNMELSRFSPIVTAFSYDKSASDFEWAMQIINNLTGGEFLQDQVGNILGHSLNLGGKIEISGFYEGRLISRTPDYTLNTAISFGHYIYGDDIALCPEDVGHNIDLFAHEFGHSYQSRIMGPLYLYRIGLPSIINNDCISEADATRRGSYNLGITIQNIDVFPSGTSTYKWYEFFGAPVLSPFMWMWNIK